MSDARIICVIDDDAAVLRGLSRLLRAWGYTVRPFSSAQQFLQQPRHDDSCIGCLVIDVYMPGMSGIELRAELELAQRRFPIIFLTGVGGDTLRRRAVADGAVCVLEKPFDDVELRHAVQEAFAVIAPPADNAAFSHQLPAGSARTPSPPLPGSSGLSRLGSDRQNTSGSPSLAAGVSSSRRGA